jgi:hypothetical protein
MSRGADKTTNAVSWRDLMAARWFRVLAWTVGSVVALFVLAYAWGFYLVNIEPNFAPHGPYNVVGFNYTDRPIATFRVNRTGGSNVLAGDSGGGGGTTCCIDIDRNSKSVVVRWALSYTGDQFDALSPGDQKNLPIERFEREVELPVLPDGSHGYLGVHFFPHQVVRITYSDRIPRPLQKIEQTLPE